MKVMTILGTRPEIIRMAAIMKKLDQYTNHVIVHTGQNWDPQLRDVFYEDLDLRQPDYQLEVDKSSLSAQIASIIKNTGEVLEKEQPDAVVILGDTNSALAAINVKRMKIPFFHIEAGDRSFDQNVPEELNRKIVDHTADILMCYTEHSRRNLLAEGIHPSKIFAIGSPIAEVYKNLIFEHSTILEALNLKRDRYIIASVHREENVDKEENLIALIESYNILAKHYQMPIIVATHPRTKKRVDELIAKGLKINDLIKWEPPFGLKDYLQLQVYSYCAVSDSGTIHEDAAVLHFKAVAIRKSTEKYEALELGASTICPLDPGSILDAVNVAVMHPVIQPPEYLNPHVSVAVLKIIMGFTKVARERAYEN